MTTDGADIKPFQCFIFQSLGKCPKATVLDQKGYGFEAFEN
jgi:hypothetical protein